MRSVKSLLAAGAATLISSMAFAADMPIAVPPPMYAPPAPPADFGGWYLRGDIGMTNQSAKRIENSSTPYPTTTEGLGFDSSPLFDLGVGYRFNNWFRADVIGQYRGKANLHGANNVFYSATDFGANNYTGSKSEWVVMANAYVDLGTWWCITPFIGAGVGGSYNKLSGFRDDGTRINLVDGLTNSVTYFADNGKWNFAWAAHAGLAYKVNPGFTVELAYSYMNLGDVATGDYRKYDSTASFPSTIKIKELTSHDIKLGVRWDLNSPPVYAPPPLVTKG